MAEFVRVAAEADVPDGTGTAVTVNGQEVALFRVDGRIYAMENECPHRQGPIAEGEVEDGIVTCPWHAWQVEVKTGAVVYNPDLCVRSFPCKVENGDVFVEL